MDSGGMTERDHAQMDRDQLRDAEREIERLTEALATTRAEAEELRERVNKLEGWIAREGYVRCDIPMCNCPWFHGGHAHRRLREIDDELGDETNGVVILDAIKARGARLATLERENRDLKQLAERAQNAIINLGHPLEQIHLDLVWALQSAARAADEEG